MKRSKMSLATIQGKMSRAEMKKILAGTEDEGTCKLDNCSGACKLSNGGDGTCGKNSAETKCFCKSGSAEEEG